MVAAPPDRVGAVGSDFASGLRLIRRLGQEGMRGTQAHAGEGAAAAILDVDTAGGAVPSARRPCLAPIARNRTARSGRPPRSGVIPKLPAYGGTSIYCRVERHCRCRATVHAAAPLPATRACR
ncbi:hypothetical protein EMIT0158MI4_10291 [Burkholderia ambifaria]